MLTNLAKFKDKIQKYDIGNAKILMDGVDSMQKCYTKVM